jgi:hypothetical protein
MEVLLPGGCEARRGGPAAAAAAAAAAGGAVERAAPETSAANAGRGRHRGQPTGSLARPPAGPPVKRAVDGKALLVEARQLAFVMPGGYGCEEAEVRCPPPASPLPFQAPRFECAVELSCSIECILGCCSWGNVMLGTASRDEMQGQQARPVFRGHAAVRFAGHTSVRFAGHTSAWLGLSGSVHTSVLSKLGMAGYGLAQCHCHDPSCWLNHSQQSLSCSAPVRLLTLNALRCCRRPQPLRVAKAALATFFRIRDSSRGSRSRGSSRGLPEWVLDDDEISSLVAAGEALLRQHSGAGGSSPTGGGGGAAAAAGGRGDGEAPLHSARGAGGSVRGGGHGTTREGGSAPMGVAAAGAALSTQQQQAAHGLGAGGGGGTAAAAQAAAREKRAAAGAGAAGGVTGRWQQLQGLADRRVLQPMRQVGTGNQSKAAALSLRPQLPTQGRR